jgi:ribosomal protein S18 acetylase RimI-like enzyme
MERSVEVRELRRDDISGIVATAGGAAWNGGFDKWNSRLKEHHSGERIALLAIVDGAFAGYGSLLWSSCYAPFRDQGISEIQDLVVSETQRRQGIATALMITLEGRAQFRELKRIGLGVGLYADYGAAQRLYIKRGYVPDGRGLTYNYLPARAGLGYPVDDDLLLWLVKAL